MDNVKIFVILTIHHGHKLSDFILATRLLVEVLVFTGRNSIKKVTVKH
jgi:hypothetical protein